MTFSMCQFRTTHKNEHLQDRPHVMVRPGAFPGRHLSFYLRVWKAVPVQMQSLQLCSAELTCVFYCGLSWGCGTVIVSTGNLYSLGFLTCCFRGPREVFHCPSLIQSKHPEFLLQECYFRTHPEVRI